MNRSIRTLALSALFAGAPSLALAHGGDDHVHGVVTGLLHPVTGVDHLLAMVAVGVIAAGVGGRAALAVPLAFLAALSAGAMLGMEGFGVSMAETGIALSLVAFGALVATRVRLPAALAVATVAAFGLAHGAAHGAEAPATASGLAYAAGFLAASALLHGAGFLATATVAAGRGLLRVAGLGTSALGLAMIAQGF